MSHDETKKTDTALPGGAADSNRNPPRSGAGAETALKAMVRNRLTRHTENDPPASEDAVDSLPPPL